MQYNPVLFDMDGTLVDSLGFICRAFDHTTHKVLGYSVPRERLMDLVVQPLETQMAAVSPDHTQELIDTYMAYFTQSEHDVSVRLFPGAGDLLQALCVGGRRLAIVTSKKADTADMALDGLGIREFFGAVVTASTIEERKPSPAPILACLKMLGMSTDSAVYIGDSPSDIQAAQAAGTAAIAVCWGAYTEDALSALRPTHTVKSMTELRRILSL